MTFNNKWLKLAVTAALLGCLSACGDDSNSNPTPGVDSGTKDSGSEAGKGGSSGGGGTGSAGTGGSGGSAGASGSGGESGTGVEDDGGLDSGPVDAGKMCLDSTNDNCFKIDDESCPPMSNGDFLNACKKPGITCTPYDNAKLTKLGDDDSLPDLP